MIKNAQQYGPLNVHMRAKRTELFTAGTYNLLASASDFENLSQMLANTKYADIIGSEMVKQYPNLIEIDRRLTQHFVDQYIHYHKYIPKEAKNFVDVLTKTYYFNNLKILLAALHNKDQIDEISEMLITLSDKENSKIEKLFKARTVEEFVEIIPDEDIKSILHSALGDYHFLNLVYPLIFALDQYFYNLLCNEITKLKGANKTMTRSLFGARIALQNIEIILRSKTFNISPKIVKNWLIATKFCPLTHDIMTKMIETDDIEKTLLIIRDETSFKELAIRLLENIEHERHPLYNFDRYAEQIIIHKANAIFIGISFNIALFPAFFTLQEIEIRNIRSIILGKIHKRSTNEILEKIVLV